ncbi:MAG: hypothetical protein IT331_20785 [Anaerolineae bacterium]|nr:hypothetical protein [Anaerolineae bacterium]
MPFSLPQRLLAALLLAAFVIATFGYILKNPSRVSAGSCAEDSANLLQNGTMAPGAPNALGVVSHEWHGFALGDTVPHFENAENEGWDPNGSQYIWRDFDAWDAGLYQRRENLAPGQRYHYWMVWGQSLHDMAGDNARSTLINRQIGVDLTGGTDPTSPNVQWSVPYYGGGGFNRPEWHLYFTATSNIATFFIRAQNGHTDGRNKVFFDTICLYPAEGNAPTATNTPTPTATTAPPTGVIEDTDTGIRYIRDWLQSNDPTASNGTFHSARGAKGAAVALKYNFTGTSVTVFYIADPNHGKARVVIDGVKMGKIDQYSPTRLNNLSQTFSGLAPGPHLIKIRNAGAKNANALDTVIVLDKLEIGNESAVVSAVKNVSQRMTATPNAAPTRTPTRAAPRLIPFKKANPAADPPADPDVIWDPRLPGLNVYLVPANVSNGTLYWKLIRADYHDPFQHGGDFGSDHTMYYVITDENGSRVPGQKVWQAWPDDSTSAFTKENGIADIPMWANYFPSNGPGPYDGYVDGLPSDMVRGMGLPANNHVSFIMYFQKMVKGGNVYTATPTATATDTPTATPTDPPAPPTFTPTATETPTQASATIIDDSSGDILYKGDWSMHYDEQTVNTTVHSGRGVKGAPVVSIIRLTGTEITIRFVGAPNHGKVRIKLDGVKRGKLDQYRSEVTYNLTHTFSGLAPGEHVLKLRSAGGKNKMASDSTITLDALEYR